MQEAAGQLNAAQMKAPIQEHALLCTYSLPVSCTLLLACSNPVHLPTRSALVLPCLPEQVDITISYQKLSLQVLVQDVRIINDEHTWLKAPCLPAPPRAGLPGTAQKSQHGLAFGATESALSACLCHVCL